MTPAEQKQFDDAFVAAQGDGKQIAIAMYELGKRVAAPAVLPAGWKAVPIKPTRDMCLAGAKHTSMEEDEQDEQTAFFMSVGRAAMAYDDMLAAAPALPAAVPVPESQPADERDRFETWLRAAGRLHESDLGHGKVFLDEQKAEVLWQAFQAGAALSAPAAPVPAASEGWISVKDRLPVSPYQKVIVWARMFYAPSYLHVGTCKDGRWNFDDSRLGEITHWQPLPAAPATSDKAEGI